MNISGYVDGYQRERAVETYKNGLTLKAYLNNAYEAAIIKDKSKYKIAPVQQLKTAEDEIRDVSLQTERAMTNLRKVLKISDAGTVLDRLRASGELTDFNRFFAPFEKEIAGQTNLTPTGFYQLWTRYREKIAATGNTGLFIPSQKSDIDNLVTLITDLIESSGLTGTEVNKISELITYLYESGMNKQIESIYKMLKTKKEYEHLVRENKLEREDIEREKKKWRTDVEAVMSGMLEAENEAKTNNFNRFEVLKNNEKIIREIASKEEKVRKIDEQISELQASGDNRDKIHQLLMHRRAIQPDVEEKEDVPTDISGLLEFIRKETIEGRMSAQEYEEASRDLLEQQAIQLENKFKEKEIKKKEKQASKKENIRELLQFEKGRESLKERSKRATELQRERKANKIFQQELQAEQQAAKNQKAKEREKRAEEEALSQEEALQQFFAQAGVRADALTKSQEKRRKALENRRKKEAREEAKVHIKLAGPLIETDARKHLQKVIEQINRELKGPAISKEAENQYRNVINQIKKDGPKIIPNAEHIIRESPVHSRRSSEDLEEKVRIVAETADDPLKAQDQVQDILSELIDVNLRALESRRETMLREAKTDEEENEINEGIAVEEMELLDTALGQHIVLQDQLIKHFGSDASPNVNPFSGMSFQPRGPPYMSEGFETFMPRTRLSQFPTTIVPSPKSLQIEKPVLPEQSITPALLPPRSLLHELFQGLPQTDDPNIVVNFLRDKLDTVSDDKLEKIAQEAYTDYTESKGVYTIPWKKGPAQPPNAFFNAKNDKRFKLKYLIIYATTGVQIEKKGGRIKGSGVINSPNYYYEFGRYLIYVPDWEKGFLRLKYPSKYFIKAFPKTQVSNDFIDVVQEMIDYQVFNEDNYLRLSPDEKELFDRLITFAGLTRNSVKELSKHRKITDKKRDDDVRRFEILKGEIIAGNDNPNVIKECKKLLIKLHNERIISKSDFYEVIKNM